MCLLKCLYAWEVWWGKVFTMKHLKKRGFQLTSNYPLCRKAKEELNHILIHCPSVWRLWEGLISILGIDWECLLLAKDLLLGRSCSPIRKIARRIWKAAPLYLVWAVWMERNRIVFDDVPFSISRLKTSFVSMLVSWAGSIELEECSIVRILLYIL